MILEGGISKNYTQNWDKNGNIYYTDENGQVVDFKINPFTKLANKAKATATNIGDWINETDPNSEAYKQKVSAIVGLETLPLGLGRFATQGIARGLAPYVGRKIAQNMATGASGGAASGAVMGGVEAGLNDRNIGLGALNGGFWGLLGGLGGGYGLGKVAQKLNTQTAWHGSPYKFEKFSNEAIGTGEGAQAHGYGHYAAKSKDIAEKRYANNPTRVVYEGKATPEIQNHPDLFDDILTKGKESVRNKYLEDLELMKELSAKYPNIDDYDRLINHAQNRLNIIDNIDESKLSRGGKGFVYKLSIPKDDVMLREGTTLAEQPKLLNRLDINNTDNVEQEMANLLDYIKNNKSNLPSEELNNLRKQYSDLSYKKMLNDPQLKSEAYYESLTDSLGSEQLANEYLLDKGIKGISYNGGIDGEANVIFNPDDIDIIPYYDNPTSLKEKFINLLNRWYNERNDS